MEPLAVVLNGVERGLQGVDGEPMYNIRLSGIATMNLLCTMNIS
jgi:hypothetical protein